MSGNLLVELMPPPIAEDLMGAGGEFRVEAGKQVHRDLLGGSHVFIVTQGIASIFHRAQTGRVSEIGMVGREGLFPLCAVLAVPAVPHIVVAHAGPLAGRVIRTKDFRAIACGDAEADLLVRKYSYAFVSQIASNLITTDQCTIAARVARALLMCHDRVDGDTIPVSHEALAQMTFSQRPTVTNMLHQLRDRGAIATSRCSIAIRSRELLREIADGTYGMSERYWNTHIGPFGKDPSEPEPQPRVARPASALQAPPVTIAA